MTEGIFIVKRQPGVLRVIDVIVIPISLACEISKPAGELISLTNHICQHNNSISPWKRAHNALATI